MHLVVSVIQVIVALVLLNVWLMRFSASTAYRGGNAHTMPEEFAAYGLPRWSMWVVGGLKVGAALCLLLGLRFPVLVMPAAVVIAVLMVGAMAMHWKIHDTAKKNVPALVMLALSVGICLGTIYR